MNVSTQNQMTAEYLESIIANGIVSNLSGDVPAAGFKASRQLQNHAVAAVSDFIGMQSEVDWVIEIEDMIPTPRLVLNDLGLLEAARA